MCDCWDKMNSVLNDKHGLALSTKLDALRMQGGAMTVVHVLPLERTDGGGPPKKGMPRHVIMNNCPFCGQKTEGEG